MKGKNIRPEIKTYIDMGFDVPYYVPLTPDEYRYIKKRKKQTLVIWDKKEAEKETML